MSEAAAPPAPPKVTLDVFRLVNHLVSFIITIIGCSILWESISRRHESSGNTNFDTFISSCTGFGMNLTEWGRRAMHWDVISILFQWILSFAASMLGMVQKESLLRRVLIVLQAGLFAYMVINSRMTNFSLLNLFRVMDTGLLTGAKPSIFNRWYAGIVICYIGAIHSFVTPLALQFGKNGKFLRLICGGCTVACGVVGLITLWTSPASEYANDVSATCTAQTSAGVELVLIFFVVTSFATMECVHAFSIMFLAGFRGWFLLSDMFNVIYQAELVNNVKITQNEDQVGAAFAILWLANIGAVIYALTLWRSYEDERFNPNQ